MTKLVCSWIVFGICALAGLRIHAQTPPEGKLILPGRGIGDLALNSSLEDFEAVFPKDPAVDDRLYDSVCVGTYFQWIDLKFHATGIFAYLKNDKIYQFSIQTPRLSISSGIGMQSSEAQVKNLYPHGRAYILEGSGSDVVGGRSLTYWVDENSGIAFEFYWNRRRKERLVGAIDVFIPGTNYQPEGCVSPPRRWRQLR